MKQFIALSLFAIPFAAQAMPDLPSLNAEQKAAMEKCVGNLDFAKLNQIEQRGMVLGQEIRSLCMNGRRSEAASIGEVFANEVWFSPELVKIRNCASEVTNSPLPDYENNKTHICDGKYEKAQ